MVAVSQSVRIVCCWVGALHFRSRTIMLMHIRIHIDIHLDIHTYMLCIPNTLHMHIHIYTQTDRPYRPYTYLMTNILGTMLMLSSGTLAAPQMALEPESSARMWNTQAELGSVTINDSEPPVERDVASD